jgi:hypothetical protein
MVFIAALSGSQNIPPALPEVTELDGIDAGKIPE